MLYLPAQHPFLFLLVKGCKYTTLLCEATFPSRLGLWCRWAFLHPLFKVGICGHFNIHPREKHEKRAKLIETELRDGESKGQSQWLFEALNEAMPGAEPPFSLSVMSVDTFLECLIRLIGVSSICNWILILHLCAIFRLLWYLCFYGITGPFENLMEAVNLS